jgi:hypothetical protein
LKLIDKVRAIPAPLRYVPALRLPLLPWHILA